MPHKVRLMIACICFAALAGCQSVKPYQRAYLNDDNMQAGRQPMQKFSGNAHIYREGASGGGKSKTGGGCGCN